MARRSFHRIWIAGKKTLVKRAPEGVCKGVHLAPMFYRVAMENIDVLLAVGLCGLRVLRPTRTPFKVYILSIKARATLQWYSQPSKSAHSYRLWFSVMPPRTSMVPNCQLAMHLENIINWHTCHPKTNRNDRPIETHNVPSPTRPSMCCEAEMSYSRLYIETDDDSHVNVDPQNRLPEWCMTVAIIEHVCGEWICWK